MSGSFDCRFVRDGPLIATVLAHRGVPVAAHQVGDDIGQWVHDPDAASPWRARFELARGNTAEARCISTTGQHEEGLAGPQHALCLLEALISLEDWLTVQALLPTARRHCG